MRIENVARRLSSVARRKTDLPALVAAALVFAHAGCSSSHGDTAPAANTLRGRAASGSRPLADLSVTLYAAGTSGAATELGSATSGNDGGFSIGYSKPSGEVTLYVVARGAPGSPVALMTSIGNLPPASVLVNELTTVASVWTSAQFLDGDQVVGNAVGVRNAAANVRNLIDIETGDLGAVLMDGVNVQTTTLAKLSSLGDLLAACVGGDCSGLFANATAPNGTVPRDTLEAAIHIARNPWHNVAGIYGLLPPAPDATTPPADVPYLPYLRYQPTDWTLSLVYTGGGLDAPGGIAFDADGVAWTNNNFLVGSQSFLGQRGFPGLGATKLTPAGVALSPRFGFTGGGIYGAGFGIAIDQRNHVWIGNFAGESVSELAPDGKPLSPAAGYPAGGQVQGTAVDQSGNVWAVNTSENTVVEYPAGKPTQPRTFGGTSCAVQLDAPFGIAVDRNGEIWVANQQGDTVTHIDPDTTEGCPVASFAVGGAPMDLAFDSLGNLWTANDRTRDSSLFDPSTGTSTAYGAGFLTGPWGLAVDGDDNVWIADFFGTRVVQLCGAGGNCPPGFAVGEAISPPAGYGGGGGVQHITDIGIDPSGNVWVLNNNNVQMLCDNPPPTDSAPSHELEVQSMSCGGNGVVVLFGLAAPVDTPMIGPPVRP